MFIISEISPQFGPDLDVAEQMILQSKTGGANAVKLQLYPADLFTENPDEYLVSRELGYDDFERLVEFGRGINMPVFATAFTEERLEWCVEVKQEYYKVAARTHREKPDLVDRITNRPEQVFVSIPGDYDLADLEAKDNCVYMYCVVEYPTLLEQVRIPDFNRSIFSGFSDHSIGISAALFACAHGCRYLEKHYTLSHALQRSNEKAHVGAMNFDELVQIRNISREMKLLAAE